MERTERGGRWVAAAAVLAWALLLLSSRATPAQDTPPVAIYPVGIRQLEFVDQDRHIAVAVFYPAVLRDRAAPRFIMPFFANLGSYRDVEVASAGAPFPLVVFSHGRGSNGLSYAWFAQTLASHGYIVAAPYHWRANTYDSTFAYLANMLWQRPVDISLDIDFLLSDPLWSKYIDPERIGQPATAKAASPRSGSAAPRSTATNISPSNKAGATTSRSPSICARSCLSTPEPALNVKDDRVKSGVRHGARHHQGLWHGRGRAASSSPCRPISPSAPVTPRRRRRQCRVRGEIHSPCRARHHPGSRRSRDLRQ